MQTNQKIPAGWSVKKVRELGRIITGSTPSMACPENYGGTFCWATAQDFDSKYISDTVTKLSEQGKNCSRILPPGSVLITCIASLGLNAITKVEMATNQQINAIIPNKKNNGEFIYYQISHNTNQLKRFAGAGGMMILTKGEFEKVPFVFPPLPEQEKIAGILGTWDEAIEKLSGLIEQKKLLKKGLMQKLLTGKTRLPSFSQPWKEVKLGEIAEFVKGKQLNKIDMVETGIYPVLNGGITYSGYTDDWNTEKDTITVSEGGNSCGYVNYIKERFWCGGHCYVINNIRVDKFFLYHLLKFNEQDIMKLRVGSGLPNIQISSLNKYKVLVPSDISEQHAIADILSTADDEINLLNQKLESTKEQKKGLMQQLLTGQIRVKVN